MATSDALFRNTLPTLVIHRDSDANVPPEMSGPRAAAAARCQALLGFLTR